MTATIAIPSPSWFFLEDSKADPSKSGGYLFCFRPPPLPLRPPSLLLFFCLHIHSFTTNRIVTATDRRQPHRETHHHLSNFDFLHITG
ncbi:hypothetical protein L2E82_39539 [Cichorium intybus]|uniref:Uncharacterized protein n=1 Tax=Cichorium intybus TaxID=13427 RepID=A0ACB9AK81_CICIN|nr:hypothetical protein L2E82_39539 [Cichorium intybus]